MYDEKPELSKAEWISVLKLSTKWFFNELRKLAISQLSSTWMSAIDRICLAEEYRVYDWLPQGHEQVVYDVVSIHGSLKGLSAREGGRIGMEVALELSGIAIRQLRRGGGAITLGMRKHNIFEAFKEEFDCIQRDEHQFMPMTERMKEEAEKSAEAERKSGELMEESVDQPPSGKKPKSKKMKKTMGMKDEREVNQNVSQEQAEGGKATSPEGASPKQLHEEEKGSEDIMGRLDMEHPKRLEERRRVEEEKGKRVVKDERKRLDKEGEETKRLDEALARELKKLRE
jgi:hypothetical protein